MAIIDTHTHIFDTVFEHDRDAVVKRAKESGVTTLILPNIDLSSLPSLHACRERYGSYCHTAIGLHPSSVDANWAEVLRTLYEELEQDSSRFIAIGEVGMDLYRDRSFAREQKDALCRQIEWALTYDLPLILHSRAAEAEVVSCLKHYAGNSQNLRGVFHSYTGDRATLETILSDLPSFMIGINGVLTFNKSALQDLVVSIPLSRLLLETDAPYLAPVPCRGQRNEPAFLVHTAAYLSEIIGVTTADLASKTTSNACRLFSLHKKK